MNLYVKNRKLHIKDDYTILDRTLKNIDLSGVSKDDAERQYVDYDVIRKPSYFGDILLDDVCERMFRP